MSDQVEEIKQKTDIIALVGEYIQLKKAGRNYRALCPFHSEKTPSFMVSPELQIYKCFGCGSGGDVYTFLQQYEGMEFPEALKFLADRAGVKLTSYKGRSDKEKFYEINSLANKFFHYLLLNHRVGKPALAYLLTERGITKDSIERFRLGFSPDHPTALATFLIGKKKLNPKDVEAVGLVYHKNNRSFDRFRGRIIFPLFDHRGNIVGFAGRILPGTKGDLAKYINTPETAVYHKGNLLYGLNLTKDEIKKLKEAVVVEGELDAIASIQAGLKNVVAIKGSALTEDQVRLLSRFSQKLTLALDSDIAGDVAARRGVTIAQSQGLEVRVAKMDEYKDPDEMARKSPQGFKKALENAVGVWDFVIDSVFGRSEAKTGEGKARISREIIPILSEIPDKIVQAHYVEVVAKKLGVPSEAVSNQVAQVERKEVSSKPEISLIVPKKKDRRQLLEERYLTLAFQKDPNILLSKNLNRLIITPLAGRILEEYKNYTKDKEEFNPSDFASFLPKELVEGFAEIILKEEENMDKAAIEKELTLLLRELEILEVKDKLSDLTNKIHELEEKGKKKKLSMVQINFSKLTQELLRLEEGKEKGIIFQEG